MQEFPTTFFIIFGATGDLMAKKIAPALFHLYDKKKLPKNFKIIAFARRPFSDQKFQDYVAEILHKNKHVEYTDKDLRGFLKNISYHQGQFQNLKDYTSLDKKLEDLDKEEKRVANKLFYLAVPPVFYETIFQNLHKSKIVHRGTPKIIVEKPFGSDLKTAEHLDEILGKLFKEDQIYRIDHYLAKEMIQNILAFRFSNNLLEDSWNNNFIERIDVRLLETEGVEDKADSYDPIGALRDVGQNHILQMLSLVTMENPKEFSAKLVRAKRLGVFEKLQPITAKKADKYTFRAQYTGYKKIDGVIKGSKTETYFKIKTYIKSPRWSGVPIYLESGKRLEKNKKEIVVTFKALKDSFCSPGTEDYKNKVTFQLEPNEKITILFWAKKPGLEMTLEKRTFRFSYRRESNLLEKTEEYEKLFMDCLSGDQTLYVSTEEVRAMWRFIDPVVESWNKNPTLLATYKPNTSNILQVSENKLLNS